VDAAQKHDRAAADADVPIQQEDRAPSAFVRKRLEDGRLVHAGSAAASELDGRRRRVDTKHVEASALQTKDMSAGAAADIQDGAARTMEDGFVVGAGAGEPAVDGQRERVLVGVYPGEERGPAVT
jgi:hypothetical protein